MPHTAYAAYGVSRIRGYRPERNAALRVLPVACGRFPAQPQDKTSVTLTPNAYLEVEDERGRRAWTNGLFG